MKTTHLKRNIAIAAAVVALISPCGSLTAAPLPVGEEVLILSPLLDEGDESTKPVSAVQPGDILTFRGPPRGVVDLGDCGAWYVSQATVRDPTGERPSIIVIIITDRPVTPGTRAEALLSEIIKFPCERPEGYTEPIRLVTR